MVDLNSNVSVFQISTYQHCSAGGNKSHQQPNTQIWKTSVTKIEKIKTNVVFALLIFASILVVISAIMTNKYFDLDEFGLPKEPLPEISLDSLPATIRTTDFEKKKITALNTDELNNVCDKGFVINFDEFFSYGRNQGRKGITLYCWITGRDEVKKVSTFLRTPNVDIKNQYLISNRGFISDSLDETSVHYTTPAELAIKSNEVVVATRSSGYKGNSIPLWSLWSKEQFISNTNSTIINLTEKLKLRGDLTKRTKVSLSQNSNSWNT